MADSVTGVPVFTLAQLKTIGAGANVVGDTTDGDTVPEAVVVRDRWNQFATVAVSDAPGDGGDGLERAYYVSKSLNNVWRRQKADIGTFDGNEDGPHFVIPE
jgi:hypothetical protein